MNANQLTHIYGVASLLVGAVGIFVGFKVGANWKEIALFASGWITAIVISFHLKSSMRFHDESSNKVSAANGNVINLEARCKELEAEKESLSKDFEHKLELHLIKIQELSSLVDQRTRTMDFLVSAKISNSALARKENDNEKVEA